MSAVRIGVVFPTTFNLNADAANAQVLAKRLQLSEIDVEVVPLDLDAMTAKVPVDALIVGSGSSSNVSAPESTSPQVRDFLKSALSAETPILAVSNGFHLWGTMTGKDGNTVAGWGLIPTRTQFGTTQHVTIGAQVQTAWGKLVGVENHNATVDLNGCDPLGTVVHGVGNNSGGVDGIHFGSLWGTHIHGPVFAMNPFFADEFASRVLARLGMTYTPGQDLAELDQLSLGTSEHLVRMQTPNHP
jgi:CobQ-like glutamine amidotransferase family enzyme